MKTYINYYSLGFSVPTDRGPQDDILAFEMLEAVVRKIIATHGRNKWKEALGLPWDVQLNEKDWYPNKPVSQLLERSSTDMGVKVIMSCIASVCSQINSTAPISITPEGLPLSK